jgi:formate dehydrogenase major subunit
VKFHAVRFIEPAENPNEEFPFILSTGRQLYQFHTGTLIQKSPTIHQKSPTDYIELHYDDAERYGIADSDHVELSARRGRL